MPRLENWSTGNRNRNNLYRPPVVCLQGIVYGHPLKPDGEMIQTSPICAAEGKIVITASGSRYELGAIDPVYLAEFPDAEKRLYESIKAFRKKLESL